MHSSGIYHFASLMVITGNESAALCTHWRLRGITERVKNDYTTETIQGIALNQTFGRFRVIECYSPHLCIDFHFILKLDRTLKII